MEDPVTINRYGYCWENPLRFVDLDGMAPTEEECKGGYYEETGGGSAVSQIYSGGKINWKDVGIDTLYNMFGKEA